VVEPPKYEERYSYDAAAESGISKVTKTVVGDANSPSIVTTVGQMHHILSNPNYESFK